MYENGIERMGRSRKAGKVARVRRGKASPEGKRATLARRRARALKYGGQR